MAKDKLHVLVHSLTTAEKKYFSQYAAAQKTDAAYLKLFELIARQAEYDEPALKVKLPQSAKNFHKLKSYLYETLLNTLVVIHREKSSALKRLEWIEQAEVLMQKKLMNEALAITDKVIATAHEVESFNHEMIGRYFRYIILQNMQRYDEAAEESEKDLALTEQRKNFTRYKNIELKYYAIKNKSKQFLDSREAETEMKKLFDDKMLQDEKQATSSTSKTIFHEMRYEYFSRYPEHTHIAIHAAERGIELMEKTGILNYVKYISFLRNLSLFYSFNQQKQKAGAIIEKLRKAPAGNELQRNYHLHYLFYVQLYYFMVFKFYAKADELIRQYEKDIEHLNLQEHEMHFNICFQLIASYYCKACKYALAIDYLQRLINSKTIEQNHPAYHAEYKLLLIVCHYEIGNGKILDALVRTAEYNFSKKNLFHKLEKSLLSFFKRYLFNPLKEKEYFCKLLDDLAGLEKDSYEKNGLAILKNIQWIEHRKKKLGM